MNLISRIFAALLMTAQVVTAQASFAALPSEGHNLSDP